MQQLNWKIGHQETKFATHPPTRHTMAGLIYWALMSLDGFIEDRDGKFDWAEPDEEVHTFVSDLERSAGTYLYGRRMYETTTARETPNTPEFQAPLMQDFAASTT